MKPTNVAPIMAGATSVRLTTGTRSVVAGSGVLFPGQLPRRSELIPRRRQPRRRGGAVMTATGGLALLAALWVTAVTWPNRAQAGVIPNRPVSGLGVAARLELERHGTSATPLAPSHLELPSLGVSAPVVAEAVSSNGALGVPDAPSVTGWWSGGAAPNSAAGSVVIDGHVDTAANGPGAFFRLRELHLGAPVLVTTGARVVTYTVTAIREYLKQSLPAEIFSQRVNNRLVLITCGGSFDQASRHYADNIVVFAVPSNG